MKTFTWSKIFSTLLPLLLLGQQGWGQTVLISPTGDGGFETGTTFAANGWTGVNGANGAWFTNTATVTNGTYTFSPTGTRSLYFSNNSGTNWRYNTTAVTGCSHFYRDITFPSGQTNINLSFRWNANGETTWDILYVYLCPTTLTPAANSPSGSTSTVTWTGTGTATLLGSYNLLAAGAGQTSSISIPATVAGNCSANSTMRLVFSWKNDGGGGTEPPAAIDDISLITSTPAITAAGGTFTIDNTIATGGTNFNSFTAAINAANNALVCSALTGPIVFNVTAGQTFNETPPALTATGTSVNTITFQRSGAGANPKITPTGTAGTADFGLCIQGGDYITFDGINIDATASSAVEFGYLIRNATATNGAQFNTIKNTIITLATRAGANTSAGILSSSSTTYGGVANSTTSAAGSNSNNKYYNFTISGVRNWGVAIYGGSGSFPETGVEVGTTACATMNSITNIGPTSSTSIGAIGVYLYNTSGAKAFNNDISAVAGDLAATQGIYYTLGYGNAELYNNRIQNISVKGSTTTSVGAYGIQADNSTTGTNNVRIYNNTITNITHSRTSVSATRCVFGIWVGVGSAAATQSYDVDNNSVSIGATLNIAVSSACFEVQNAAAVYRIRGNIFANYTAAQGATAKHYAVRFTSTTWGATGSVSDYNDYYIPNDLATSGFISLVNATNSSTLVAHRAALITPSGQDVNSLAVDPGFTNNNSNLHASGTAINAVSGFTPQAWVTTDMDCETRSTLTPSDLGADAFTPATLDMGVSALTAPNTSGCYGNAETVTATIKNYSALTIDFSVNPVTVTVNVTGAVTQTLSTVVNTGTLAVGATQNVNMSSTLNMSTVGTYTFNALTAVTGDGNSANDALSPAVTRTVSAIAAGTASASTTIICASGTTTLTLAGSTAGATIQWQSSLDNFATAPTNVGTNSTTYTSGTLTSGPIYYRAQVTCGAQSGNSNVLTINVNPIPTASVTPSSASYCGVTPVALTASGGTSYAWSPATGLSATNTASVNASPATSTTYTVTVTSAGCTASTSVIVSSAAAIGVTATATPPAVCSGGSSQLLATALQAYNNTAAAYSFAASTGTYSALVGGTSSTATGDDATQGSIPIGFTFNYNGTNYTTFGLTTNGAIQLGSTSGPGLTNALASNAVTLAPMWDDNNRGTGTISYLMTGTAPNRIMTIDWNNVCIGGSGSTSNPTSQYQIQLFETSNVVRFIYGNLTPNATLSASIGISGGATNNYISITPAASPTASTSTENASISATTFLPSGTIYTFTPPTPPTYTYSWSASPSSPTTLAATNIANPMANSITANTAYTVTVTGLAGCTSTASVTVTAGSPLVVTPTASPASICTGGSSTLAAGATGGGSPYTYLWDTGATTATISVSPSATTSYSVTVTDNCGATLANTVTVTVNPFPSATITPTPSTAAICGSGSVVLAVPAGAGSYAWAPATGLSATNTASVTATPAATTTYTVTVTTAGCSTTASQVVTLSTVPTGVTAAASTTTVCSGSTVDLLGTPASVPALNFTEGFESGIPATWTVINAGTGNTWTANLVGGAARTGTRAIEYYYNSTNAANTWIFTPAQTLTAGVTYSISYWTYTGSFNERLKLSVGNAATVAAQTTVLQDLGAFQSTTYTQRTTTFTPSSTGTYYFSWNCYSAANRFFLNIDDISITAPAVNYTYAWSSTPSGYTSSVQNPTGVTPTNGIVYNLTVTNSAGCTASASTPAISIAPLPAAPTASAASSQCGLAVPTCSVSSNTGAGAPVFKWYDAASGGTLLQTGTSTTYTTAISSTTTFYVSELYNGCESTRTPVVANVTTPDAVSFTAPSTICVGSALNLTVTQTGSTNTYTYTWGASPATGSGVSGTPTGATQSFVPAATGTYIYTVTATDSGAGCITGYSQTVTVYPGLSGTVSATQITSCTNPTGLITPNVTGAGTIVNNDFTSSTLPANMTSAGNDFAITGGRMQLTSAANSKNGGVLITNTTGLANNDFQIDFDFIATSSGAAAADGFSYSYGDDVVALPSGTATTTGVTTLQPENGSGTKLKLSFDAINNTGGCPSVANGNVAGIYLMYNETTLHQGATCPGILYASTDVSWRASGAAGNITTTHVTIRINSSGQISMWLNGVQVVNNVALPAAYLTADKSTWKHAFAARTGGLNQGQAVDNLVIQYNNFYEYSIDSGTSWTTNNPIVPSGPGTYSVDARYVSVPACTANLGTVTINPLSFTTNATVSNLCAYGTATTTLSFSPSFTGATYQWESSPAGANTWSAISGANAATYTPAAGSLTANTDFRCVISCSGTPITGSPTSVRTITVEAPTVGTPAATSVCGSGTSTLSTTGNTGTVSWYTAATGGTLIGTGTTVTSPTITGPTTYYVEAAGAAVTANGARIAPTSTSNTTAISYGLVFDVTSPTILLNSVDVYNGSTAGTAVLQLQNSAGTVLQTSGTFNIPLGAGTTPTTLPLGWTIPAGTGYRLLVTSGTASLVRETSLGGFPYSIPGGSITNGYISGTSTTYYYLYNWNVSIACTTSPRTAVAVPYITPPSIGTVSATPSTICAGQSSTLAVTGADASYTAFTWSNSAGTGTSVSVSPTTSTTYTVTATGAGCIATGSAVVTVNPVPTTPIVTPATATICTGQVQSITASGATTPGTLLQESFNAGTGLFTTVNASSSAIQNWTNQANGYVYSTTYSGSVGNFVIANSDAGGTGSTANTILVSPAFSTLGYSTLSLQFREFYNGANDLANVEISDDNFTTTTVLIARNSGTADIGTSTAFNTTTIAIPASFENKASVKIRFRFEGTYDYNWAVDEILLTGLYNSNYTWSPTTGLYTDLAATVGYTGTNLATVYASPASSTVYTVVATNTFGCTSTASSNITVNALTAGTASSNISTACATATPVLTLAGSAGTIDWERSTDNFATAGISTGVSTLTYNSPAITTTTYFRAKISCGGTDVYSNVVTVTINANPAASISPASIAICSGATQTLTASPASGVNYAWSSGLGTSSTVSVSPTTATNYSVTVTDATTLCTATATASVRVNLLPATPTVSPATTSNCAGASVTLTAAGVTGSGVATQGAGGTTSSPTTNASLPPNPFQDKFGGCKMQTIYRASELTALGLGSGTKITSISFYVVDPSAVTYTDFRIKAQLSATATLNTTPVSTGWTTVYNPNAITIASGFNTFVLNTPIVWDGTSNLLLETNYSNNNTANGNSATTTVAYDATGFTCTNYYRINSVTSGVIDAYAMTMNNAVDRRIQTQFDYINPTYTWTPTTNLTPTTGLTVTATPPATQTYTVVATTNDGCTATSSATINIQLQAAGVASSNIASVCVTGSPVLTLTGAVGTIDWETSLDNFATAGVSTGVNTTTYTSSAITSTTYYRAKVTCGGTDLYSNVVTVTVNSLPVASISPAVVSICPGASQSLSALPAAGMTYVWSNSLGTSGTVSVTPAATTTYTVTVTDVTTLCTAAASSVVTVLTPPVVTLSTNPSINCPGSTSTLTATPTPAGTYSYVWSVNTNGGTASTATATVNSGTNTYTVTATNTITGCTASATIAVEGGPITTDYTICAGSAVSGGLIATATCPAVTSLTTVTQLTGTNSATDPTYTRSAGGTTYSASGSVNYDAFIIRPTVSGSYTFAACANGGDSHGQFYTAPFNPASPATNFMSANDDGNTGNCGGNDPLITVTLTAGVDYVYVFTQFTTGGGSTVGAYTITWTGPGNIQTSSTVAGSLQWYTASAGGTSIGTGSPFNPVGVAGSGLANTNTPGTYTYYAQCSAQSCRVPVDFIITPSGTTPVAADASGCGAVTLVATSSGTGTVEWYASSNRSTPLLGTGNTYTTSTSGTYYAFENVGGGACYSTGDAAIATVSASTVGLTGSPSITCGNSSVNFTASGAGLYEFFVNGVSAGTATTTPTYSYTAQPGDLVYAKGYPNLTLDGTINTAGSEYWGNAIMTAAGGPTSCFGPNRASALYFKEGAGSTVNIGLAGNLDAGNRMIVFIDSKAGGANNKGQFGGGNTSNAQQAIQNIGANVTFDAGFNADYAMIINTASGNYYVDLYDLQTNTNYYQGYITGASFNNGGGNAGFKGGFSANANETDYTHGWEIILPNATLGRSEGNGIAFFPMVTNDGASYPTYISNHFLSPAASTEVCSDYGNDPNLNFGTKTPNPVNISAAFLACDNTSPTQTITSGVTGNVALAAPATNGIVLAETCVDNGWVYYSNPSNNDWYFAVNWNPNGGVEANSAQRAAAQVTVDVSTPVTGALYGAQYVSGTSGNPGYYRSVSPSTSQGTFTMQRYWNVNVGGGALPEAVNVRFYFDPAEYNAVLNAAQTWSLANGGYLEGPKWFKTVAAPDGINNSWNPANDLDPNTVEHSGWVMDLNPLVSGYGYQDNVRYVQFNGVTSFSGGGLVVGVGNGNALPLELLYFTGTKDNGVSRLSWATANEQNSSHFVVERSRDGINFTAIGQVAAAGNSTEERTYYFNDVSPMAGDNYYRLRSVDIDNSFTNSNIINLNYAVNFGAEVYPNPFQSSFTVDIFTEQTTSNEATIELFDLLGRTVHTGTVTIGNGRNSFTLDNATLTPGTYMLKITSGNNTVIRKIVKNEQ